MNLTRSQREELKELSLEVFGSSSTYQKLMEKGYVELKTTEVEEEVPGTDGAPSTTRMVKIQVLENGRPVSEVKRHSYESIKQLMTERKAKIAELKAMIDQMNKEKEAKAAQDQANALVSDMAGGSAR